MLPSQDILRTWKKFDNFPMETLTKAWLYKQGSSKKQRDVSLMKKHREQFGITGNCFDLTIWLLDEFKKDGIEAYPIAHNLNTEDAHVAVIALDEFGHRFYCDLGDQWLKPILIETDNENFNKEKLDGFFPATKVQVNTDENSLEILYHRPNGKVSKQIFDTQPIEINSLMKAAEFSQSIIKPKPLFECRVPYKSEIAHWEFYNWESFLSTTEGLLKEPKLNTIEEWVEKINRLTGYDKNVLYTALEIYKSQPK
ncbi:hypothetical protein [Chengkuizengella axinellae]|uniref:Uncharacterized protein n=1 Tax=Chengkuizengella axinellae TaxID=3064388 RepID=A0ABT9J544_9BACL|nr:hypothetical protein [Chengkuizengella sp. 2205SS18-9]MDP5276728.1 hypothetical protein [Chengkuizengella sp. 2205SS18-9]